MRVAAKWRVRCLNFPSWLLDPCIYSLGETGLQVGFGWIGSQGGEFPEDGCPPLDIHPSKWTRLLSAVMVVNVDRVGVPSPSLTCLVIFKSERRTEFAPCPVQELSPAMQSNNHTPLPSLLRPGLYHAWLVFHSAEPRDRPMKLPALLWVKPKTNHYGCPIRVIIRLSTGPGDYGVAKWLLWGLN